VKTPRTIWLRIRSLWRRPAVKQEIDEELRFHWEQRTAENLAAGMAPEDAARAARKRFGNVPGIRETCRDTRGVSLGEATLQDGRFGLRMLRKNPGFTAVVVFTLALGIGAGTAIFSLANAILLRSLPVPSPHELRIIGWSGADLNIAYSGRGDGDMPAHYAGYSVSVPLARALREQCAAQADVFGYSEIVLTARARHEAARALGMMVSDNFFSGLGVPPLIGRRLGAEDERAGAAPSVVISYRWWERQFDLDPGVLGRPVTLSGFTFTVVGVLPRGFSGVISDSEVEFYVPMSFQRQLAPDDPHASPNPWIVDLMARLKPGVSDGQLQAALNVAFVRETEGLMKQAKVLLTDGRAGPEKDPAGYRGPLMLLLGMVGLVLLVACANLAGLSLARGAVRQHEFAVRAALGAGRWRLIRQSLTESVLVALLGGGLGLVVALWGKTAISRLLAGSPEGLHYDIAFDLRVLGFSVAVALLTAALSGLLPALQAARVDPRAGLKDRATLGAPPLRAGRLLVAAQIALSLLLVAGAGLYVRTLVNLMHINPGFVMENLLQLPLSPEDAGKEPRPPAFFDRVLQSLATIPGVRSVALFDTVLLSGGWEHFGFAMPGRASEQVNLSIVSEGFFGTMGIPLALGRDLRPSDGDGAAKVVVVNEAFVRKYFPDRNPIDFTITETGSRTDWQIVGVCRDARYEGLKTEPQPTAFFSFRQHPLQFGAVFYLRTAVPPLALAPAARQAVAAVDPNIPLNRCSTGVGVRNRRIQRERMFVTLCGSLAALAVLLSCIGLYGLMAYHVARRTGEIGIRLALGATRRQIAGPILREALTLAGIGLVIGLPLTLALTRLIRSNLYGVAPSDPVTLGGAVVLLLMVAVIAAWLPARRAAKVDPLVALRYE